MIQLKTPYTHTALAVSITGTLLVEIVSWQMFKDFAVYNIEDSIILENGAKQMINSRQKRVEASEINKFDDYLATLDIDFASLPKTERDWLKAKYALLPFVQTDFIDEANTKTIYNRLPSEWIYSE